VQARPAQRSGLSLNRKLPLLIGGLVAASLLGTLVLVKLELRSSAVDAAADRLALVTDELGETLQTALEARARTYAAAAADPAVTGLVTGRSSDITGAHRALDALRQGTDRDLPIHLVSATGRTLTATGRVGPSETIQGVQRADRLTYGRFMPADSGFAYWVSIPVTVGGSVVGHILQQRGGGGGSPALARLETLLGSDIELFVAHRQGGPWAALDSGILPDAPAVQVSSDTFTYSLPDEREFFAYARAIDGTPWSIVAQMPVPGVTARMDAVLRRIALTGMVLLALGLLAAWLLSRSVTRPLGRLGSAADAIAAGDYSRRVHLDRTDEIGRLARSFDAMAARVDDTHAQLEQRFRHAQSLAAELELANARLHHAIADADTARRDAQQASTAKSEFLATMSHEIRTPINAIIGYTDLMDMRLPGPLTREQEEYVQRIRLSGEHLISVVNDVLDFAKIESGQMRISREPTSARAVIDAAVAMLQARARTRHIELHVDAAPGLLFLGDAQRAQQILLNLLSNALKFTAERGSVFLSSERRDSRGINDVQSPPSSWTCIVVRDTGIGIAPDQIEPIFEPFVQGAGGYTRTHGGTGLGLAISRSLARMMDGDLTVESQPGAGSTFTLWLPHAAAPATAHR
jgi:signal transduction histidine kinase